MMAIGGWSDCLAIEPYPTEPIERRVRDAVQSNWDRSLALILLGR